MKKTLVAIATLLYLMIPIAQANGTAQPPPGLYGEAHLVTLGHSPHQTTVQLPTRGFASILIKSTTPGGHVMIRKQTYIGGGSGGISNGVGIARNNGHQYPAYRPSIDIAEHKLTSRHMRAVASGHIRQTTFVDRRSDPSDI